ncbi:hypothetical protein C3L33_18542, partial [Rhododendron williamsianum]
MICTCLVGIGFKSVFLVSGKPHIYSNGYQIMFDEAPSRDCGIGYIVPEWVPTRPTISDLQVIYGLSNTLPATTIILPLKTEKLETVKQHLSEIHPEVLLFLHKIKRLSVRENSCFSVEDSVSAISISSETNLISTQNQEIDSRIVHLSAQEGQLEMVESTCRYYIYKQMFPVKPENVVDSRRDLPKWAISLAFPFGDRLMRGTSSVGIFAFLPTAMVTNFPFVVHADFILSSSREAIVLDNKWNLGILDHVPSAFVNALMTCMSSTQTAELIPIVRAIEFLPVQESPLKQLNGVRESIRLKLRSKSIVPCESFSIGEMVFCEPIDVVRILPEFRKILTHMRQVGVSFKGVSSQGKYVLHNSADDIKYDPIWNFLAKKLDINLHRNTRNEVARLNALSTPMMLGVMVDFNERAHLVARGLVLPEEPVSVTAECAFSFLSCASKLKGSKWLKTHVGYRTPEDSLIFDPEWNSYLEERDGPFIDQGFYGNLTSLHKDELIAIGVKADTEDVCTSLFQILTSKEETSAVMRICRFLHKYMQSLNSQDCFASQLWIPDQEGNNGKWWKERKYFIFIPDDLSLKKLLREASEKPLFVWFPQNGISSLSKLYEIYRSFGVRKISEAIQISANSELEKMGTENSLIGKPLIKIVLAFVANPVIYMPVEERHRIAKSLLDISLVGTEKSLMVSYFLDLPSSKKRLRVEMRKLVLWGKNSQKLLVHKPSWNGGSGTKSMEFITDFSRAIAEAVLSNASGFVEDLCKIIKIGFAFGFKEDEVDSLLLSENLELFPVDASFLECAFPAAKNQYLGQDPPCTPEASIHKKQRRY